MQKEFNQETLAEFDGRDGSPVYVARDGKVYDVSDSKLWQGGEHMKRHHAGRDLSADFSSAPHGPEVFERFSVVGAMQKESSTAAEKDEQDLPAWLIMLMKKYPALERHPHPMLVHFPIAFMFAAPIFSLLAILTGDGSFEATSFHCLVAGLLFTPLTIATGFLTWWRNYKARMLKAIRMKIIGSGILMLLIIILSIWRYRETEIVFTDGGLRMLYLFLLVFLLPLVSLIGWYGASLTFPSGKRK